MNLLFLSLFKWKTLSSSVKDFCANQPVFFLFAPLATTLSHMIRLSACGKSWQNPSIMNSQATAATSYVDMISGAAGLDYATHGGE